MFLKFRDFFLLIGVFITIFTILEYRFKNPHKTETELFLEIPKAFKKSFLFHFIKKQSE